jgi:hypothetical protein
VRGLVAAVGLAVAAVAVAAPPDPAARARRVLARGYLIDGHNDLPWVIREDEQAKGDLDKFDITGRARAARPTCRACARG